MFTRIVGWIFVFAGLVALVFDGAVSVMLDQRTPVALRQWWPGSHPSSFALAEFLRDSVLGFWSGAALLAVGILFLIMFSRPVDRA